VTTGVPAPGGIVRIKAAQTVETTTQAVDRTTEELGDFLADNAELFKRGGTRYQIAVRFGDPAAEIVRYAEEEKVDLIMMATHGHTGLARIVSGSVVSRVVESGVCPIVLVRPAGLKDG
jgi:nucleotide-binding universal stress UspA family protein